MGHNAGFEDPCEVVRILKAQVEIKMIVTKKDQIATPDYLAGWYSEMQDLNSGLKCGLVSHDKDENSTVWAEE